MSVTVKKTFRLTVQTADSRPFGRSLLPKMPPDADVMIVCVNTGYGLIPKRLLLPHQLYTKDLESLFDGTQGSGLREVVCIPARSVEYATVAKGR